MAVTEKRSCCRADWHKRTRVVTVACAKPCAGICQQLLIFCKVCLKPRCSARDCRGICSPSLAVQRSCWSIWQAMHCFSPSVQRALGPPWHLFSSVPLLLRANSPRAVLPTAGGSQGEEAVSGLGQQSENHLAFLSRFFWVPLISMIAQHTILPCSLAPLVRIIIPPAPFVPIPDRLQSLPLKAIKPVM